MSKKKKHNCSKCGLLKPAGKWIGGKFICNSCVKAMADDAEGETTQSTLNGDSQ